MKFLVDRMLGTLTRYLRFMGYEESRALFEETARMSTHDALMGKEDVVARLSELVRKSGMEPKHGPEWKPGEPAAASLDFYC